MTFSFRIYFLTIRPKVATSFVEQDQLLWQLVVRDILPGKLKVIYLCNAVQYICKRKRQMSTEKCLQYSTLGEAIVLHEGSENENGWNLPR